MTHAHKPPATPDPSTVVLFVLLYIPFSFICLGAVIWLTYLEVTEDKDYLGESEFSVLVIGSLPAMVLILIGVNLYEEITGEEFA